MKYATISPKEAAKQKNVSIPTVLNWIGSKIIAEKKRCWYILLDDCFRKASKSQATNPQLASKITFVSKKINAGMDMFDAVSLYDKNMTKKEKKSNKKSKSIIKPLIKSSQGEFVLGQNVLWLDSKTKTTKIAMILNIKKRVQIEFDDHSKSWVAKSNLRIAEKEISSNKEKPLLIHKKATHLEGKVEGLDKEVIKLQQEVAQAIEERDKAREYRIDLENKSNQMSEKIKDLQELLDKKENIIDGQKLQIDELKDKMSEHFNTANRNKRKNEKLTQELDDCKKDLDQTQSKLEETKALKVYNQVQKLALEEQLAEKEEKIIYIPTGTATAERRAQDIKEGKPIAKNIRIIDVEAMQAELIRKAKEKYKDHPFVKVMRDTVRRKEENLKKEQEKKEQEEKEKKEQEKKEQEKKEKEQEKKEQEKENA